VRLGLLSEAGGVAWLREDLPRGWSDREREFYRGEWILSPQTAA